MTIRHLKVDRVLLLRGVLLPRLDGDQVGSDVRVEHGEIELEVREVDG